MLAAFKRTSSCSFKAHRSQSLRTFLRPLVSQQSNIKAPAHAKFLEVLSEKPSSKDEETTTNATFTSGLSSEQVSPEKDETKTTSKTEHAEKVKSEISLLFKELRSQAMNRLSEFTHIHLYSLVWAFATAKILDPVLWQSVKARACRLSLREDHKRILGGGHNKRKGGHSELSDSSRDSPVTAPKENNDSTNSSSSIFHLDYASNQLDRENYIKSETALCMNYNVEDLQIVKETPHWFILNKTCEWKVNQSSDGSGSSGPSGTILLYYDFVC